MGLIVSAENVPRRLTRLSPARRSRGKTGHSYLAAFVASLESRLDGAVCAPFVPYANYLGNDSMLAKAHERREGR
jgi:hypothetical protein